jgi:hypothetical protein
MIDVSELKPGDRVWVVANSPRYPLALRDWNIYELEVEHISLREYRPARVYGDGLGFPLNKLFRTEKEAEQYCYDEATRRLKQAIKEYEHWRQSEGLKPSDEPLTLPVELSKQQLEALFLVKRFVGKICPSEDSYVWDALDTLDSLIVR